MTRPTLLPALCVASIAGALSAQTPSQAADALGLSHADVIHVQLTGYPGSDATATFELEGTPHLIELESFSIRTSGFRLVEQREGDVYVDVVPQVPLTYRGFAPTMPDSHVRASWLGDGLHARIRLEDGSDLWIEPLQDKVLGASQDAHALYRSTDVIPGYGTCAADVMSGGSQFENSGRQGDVNTLKAGTLTYAELALDADFEYYQSKGSSTANTTANMENVINAMNSQYEADCSITHYISHVIVRTTNNDPYSSTSAGTLLNQMTSHWYNQQGSVQRDVAELFTGKNISGSTIGIAWLGGVCNSSGYNVVQSDCCGGLAAKTDLSAHELGHNWAAGHCSCTSFTMNSFLTAANRFTNGTINTITNWADNHGCVNGNNPDPGGGGGGGGGGGSEANITSVSPPTVSAVNPDGVTVTLTGTGFTGVTKVTVGGIELSTFPPQWQVVNDTTLTLSLPQLSGLGNHSIELEDPDGDDSASIAVIVNLTPTIDLVNSNPGFLLSALGAELRMGAFPNDTMFLVVSPVLGTTALPGLFTAGIGAGNTSELFYINSFVINPATGWTGVTVPFSLPTGFAIHFQGFNLGAFFSSLPLKAINVESGTVLF